MSLLNQLFNRGVFGAKCKTCLTLAISRIKLLQNKRDMQLKHMRKEIAQFLQAGQEPIARIRVEHVIREQNVWAAYEILELFCEFVLARVPILESQKECPVELREAISSIIFASPRCSEVPDLLQIKNLFTTKYGKEFVMAASELRPDSGVNRTIVEKLSVSAPSAEARLTVLKEIAKEYRLDWDSSNTEAELSKQHEDLLGGSKQIVRESTPTQAPIKQHSPPSNPLNESQAVINTGRNPGSLPPSDRSTTTTTTNDKRETVVSESSSDVLERARAAMAYAERATTAARAAALLANREFGSTKPEEDAE